MRLNDENIKPPARPKKASPALKIPEDLQAALANNKAAKTHFEQFSPGKKRDYLEWLTEAKTAPTRLKRLNTAIVWISEGKVRNWKYEKC
ncbi:MAG: YdeI/OmpD-associated family protein [Chitinophagaceae bacterium]